MNSTKKLLQFEFNTDAFARRVPQLTAIPSERLAVLKKIIKDHDGSGSDPPNQESLHQIYQLFKNTPLNRLSSEFDSLRRTRQLAWALTYTENGSPRIVDTPRLRNALQLIEKRFRIGSVLGIFDALMKAWDTPNAGMLRVFLKKHLTHYTGSRKFVQKLKTNMAWYCEENSVTQFATHLFRSQKKLSNTWTYLELPDRMHGYPYFGAVATTYISLNNRFDQEAVTDVVDFVKKHNNDKTNRIVLSKLIEKLGSEATKDLRQPVQSYVLQNWQDPRIAGADIRWRNVSDKARQIFTKWITEEDLRFFFDIVARACGDPKFEYRKAFWLSYLEHISFCRPVLRKDAEYLFRYDKQALQYYQDRQPATLKGGTRDQHAFIIQMGEYIFVEFSTAAACHVYHFYNISSLDPFELDVSDFSMSTLRNGDRAIHRVIHTYSNKYSWQNKFALWLKNRLSIEPLRSYRLDGRPNSYDTSEWWNY
ncbi:hypothetical protein C6503_05000 [Candidatus Poribacteria bacterium]|nr:MAG: hypothetical protein C6503_05000 [Candidatus Poribacteria bacterium]